MEERQRQIVEGAGRDESRLNQDLIDQLKKWGPYLLMGIAIVAGGYALYNRWQEHTEKAVDDAFVAFQAASEVGRPEGFLEVASEHKGQETVEIIAKLSAADAWLRSSRTGIPAGMQLDRDGKLPPEKTFLTDEERKTALASAEKQYHEALAACDTTFGQTSLAVGSLFGLASVAEDRGELDKARGFYQQAADRAKTAGMTHIDEVVKERLESLDKLKEPTKLYAQAELPAVAAPPQVIPMGGMTGRTADGREIDMSNLLGGQQGAPQPIIITPEGTVSGPRAVQPGGATLTPVPAPTPPPTPAPAPAPGPAPAGEKPAETPKP